MSEYTNSSAGSAACTYAPLGQYNASYSMNNVPFQGKVTTGNYIVPSWGSIGYDALTNQNPSCSGYFDIQSAYGSDAGNCQTDYTSAACGSGGDQTATQQLGALVNRAAPTQQRRM